MLSREYDIIVVGAGHAGCEAAAAAANLGSKTLLVTMDMTKFAQMSCNPAIGGIAKGQIVREIDALGGLMGIITDLTTIHFRMLNRSKGPAMWSPRAQCDRAKYSEEWRMAIEKIPNLDLMQDNVSRLIVDDRKVSGVITGSGISIKAKAVILANGTFLNGLMHIGKNQAIGGRIGEPASNDLSSQLKELGFSVNRMKTGTPPRIDGRSIRFDKMIEQGGEEDGYKFSYLPGIRSKLKGRSCFITYTNHDVHHIIEEGIQYSPLYDGTIKSIGPRYCPSIETKIKVFGDKDRHQIFLEPEGEFTNEYYINGFSTSLPVDIQYNALRRIEGLEDAVIIRPGYAIEYDYFDPTGLQYNLETKLVDSLFFAGQINGTTGYEEAGGQGLMAGINAHMKIKGLAPFVLKRDEAYIGVLIDDLVTKGVDEPYRMFTSRAEYRILLRQDNADFRLTEKSVEIGLAKSERLNLVREKYSLKEEVSNYLKITSIEPVKVNPLLEYKGTSPVNQKVKMVDILSRPQINIYELCENDAELNSLIPITDNRRKEILESAEIEVKYGGYIVKEQLISEKIKRLENVTIPKDFNYQNISSLSTEARQKLSKIRPETLAQAARISGVSPADLNVLLVFLGR